MKAELIERAKAVMENAYAPYSKFKVGASILTETGKVYAGCNIENVSYSLTLCAEASAIAAMVAAGDTIIKTVVITTSVDTPCSPCGACLQRLHEFSVDETLVAMVAPGGSVVEKKLKELLPFSFDRNNMGL